MITEERERRRLAFNQGSDARLQGQACSRNPYDRKTERLSYNAWQSGWKHVDSEWGLGLTSSRRTGYYRPLPQVKPYRRTYPRKRKSHVADSSGSAFDS